MGNKRQKRLAKRKKDNNVRKNNLPTKMFMWMPANKPEPEITKEVGQNVLHPREIDPDWEYEMYKQEKSDMEDEKLQAWANNDLDR